MARKHKEWARRQRNQLHFLLGNKCCDCGTTENLQLDCDIPQGSKHHKQMAWDSRMSFYWKQFHAGNLRLRCLLHNATKGSVQDKAYFAQQRAMKQLVDEQLQHQEVA